jgi:murein DD-endopeptidase MepM/ murein hydrolase activator NlpD
MKYLLILVLLVAAAFGGLFALSHHTDLKLPPELKVVGSETPMSIKVDNESGIKRLTVYLEQNGQRYPIYEQKGEAHRFGFWRHKQASQEVKFTAGQKQAAAVKEGKAKLVVAADSADLRGSTDEISRDIEVILRPPSVSADGFQHYINQGGCELVTFTLGGYWTEAGVRVGKHTFRSFPMPGGKENERFSLFAFTWDTPADTVPVVYARNPAGAEVTAQFWFKVFPKPFRKRDLDLADSFLQKVVPEIDPQGSGDLLPRFLKINGDLRRENNKTIADLRLKTAEKFLWTGPFQQLGNSKVESQFADTRSYIYQGKKVDEQTHLGFDLSVTQHVGVAASNDGIVVWADRLGIYGNCIVVDHGYGLQSIYAHLSEINVKPGEAVKRGQIMGKSGATGLAGGDHLHFSMQVDGVQVNPVEWWDEHWIKDRVLSKVPKT